MSYSGVWLTLSDSASEENEWHGLRSRRGRPARTEIQRAATLGRLTERIRAARRGARGPALPRVEAGRPGLRSTSAIWASSGSSKSARLREGATFVLFLSSARPDGGGGVDPSHMEDRELVGGGGHDRATTSDGRGDRRAAPTAPGARAQGARQELAARRTARRARTSGLLPSREVGPDRLGEMAAARGRSSESSGGGRRWPLGEVGGTVNGPVVRGRRSGVGAQLV